MSDAETALMSGLLLSMIPDKDTECPEGLLQLAADFWITNYRYVNTAAVVPLLSHPGLSPEKALRIVELGSGSVELLCAYLSRPDPVDLIARQINAAARSRPDVLRQVVPELQSLRPEVAELLVDVADGDLLLVLAKNKHVPFLARVRALKRAYNLPLHIGKPRLNVKSQVRLAAGKWLASHELDDGDDVEDALRLLQDTPDMLSIFESAIAGCSTVVLTDESVALLRWSENLANHTITTAGGKWCSSKAVRTAVFDYLHGRFGMHVPSWDMFAKLASPDLRIGEIADLVLEVETPDS